MKTMTCNQLGGACNEQFTASSFEEIATLSKKHGMEMFQKGDAPHIEAMNKMMEMMKTPDAMKEWFNSRQSEFNAMAANK